MEPQGTLVILVDVVNVTFKEAKCGIEPPDDLPVQTSTTPVKIASLSSRHLIANHAPAEPLDNRNGIEEALCDGLLGQQGLLSRKQTGFACSWDASAENAIFLLWNIHGFNP